MADEKDDDALEIIEMDALPQGDELRKAMEGAPPKTDDDDEDKDKGAPAGADDDDDDDDAGDERLAEREDDDTDPKRRRRRERRQVRNQARDRTLAELAELRQSKNELERRLAAVEGGVSAQSMQQIDRGIAEAQRQLAAADQLMARAVEAGNGADLTEALRLRDAARDEETRLSRFKTSVEQQPAPAAKAAVAEHARQWREANTSWYRGAGATDVASATANRIEAEMMHRDKLDPSTADYWKELTRRVAAEFKSGQADDPPARRTNNKDPKVDDTPETDSERRRAPPVGQERSGAAGGRNGVVVTPERKQAMQEAGVWDDPELRKRYLKSYQDFDRNNQSAR